MSLHPGIVVGIVVLVVLTTGLAVLGLYLVWRNGYVRGWRAARVAGPCCAKCGYNLSGLVECRCPECGSNYKLEDLFRCVPSEVLRLDLNQTLSKD